MDLSIEYSIGNDYKIAGKIAKPVQPACRSCEYHIYSNVSFVFMREKKIAMAVADLVFI